MAKKEEKMESKRIPVEEIVEGATYKTYVNDTVKVEKVNHETKTITLYNASGAHRQWTSFQNIYLVERMR